MSGLGATFRSNVLNYILRAGTAPGRVATYYVSLHTADPGADGAAGANEVSPTGTAYTRQSIASTTGWTVPAAGTPYTLLNAATLTWAAATGAGFGTVTHFGIWNAGPAASGNSAAANYVGGGALTSSQIVNVGNVASIAIGALSLSITTVTSGSTTGMCTGFRKLLYDYLLTAGSGGGTDPLAATGATVYTSLHTGDPGIDGLSNEVSTSGTAYARASVTRSGAGNFTAATVPTGTNPSIITNATTAITYAAATGAGFGTVTWFAIWRLASAGAAGDCLLRGTTTSQAVATGNTASFATSTLSTQLEVT